MKISVITQPNTTITNKTGGWRTVSRPKFIHDKCTACSICRPLCPEGIIQQGEKTNAAGKKYFDCDLAYCKGCSLCAMVCPFKAIEMERDAK